MARAMRARSRDTPIKVVLDTNVIVAGLRSRRGASFLVLDLVERGRLDIALNAPLIAEYDEVIRRPEHRRIHSLSEPQIRRFLRGLITRAEIVETRPDRRIRLSRDPDDAIVVEAAIEGRADYLVTHNIRDFLEVAGQVTVLTPAELLRRLAS
jgi:putative PIN family toxin of toxin-antitoxin system